MRECLTRVLVTILALLLPACASQPASNPVPSQAEAEVLLPGLPALKSDKVVIGAHGGSAYIAASAGCIKKSIDTCLKSLQTGFRSLPFDNVSDQMKNNDAVDVNGKHIRSKNLLIITGYMQGWSSIQSVDLTYTSNRIVDYIGISLPGDPDMANTTEEYEKTGLYEAMRLLLGSDCPSLNQDEAFKFFQNSVKPRIVREGRKVSINDTNAEIAYFQKAIDIPLCGLKFSYMKLFGYDTDYITIDNPHGAYIRNSISFN